MAYLPSLIGPLNEKLAVFNSHIGLILRGLAQGDPEAIKQVQSIQKDISNLWKDGKAIVSQLISTQITSASVTISFLPNPVGFVTAWPLVTGYWINEVSQAYKFVKGIEKLITSLISITTLIQFFMVDLMKLQKALNTATLYLIKAVARAKQKLSKNIEWLKRILGTNLNLLYFKAQLEAYKYALVTLQAQVVTPPANPGLGGNGTYITDSNGNKTFVYFNQTYSLNTAILGASNASTQASLSNLAPAGLSSVSTSSSSIFSNAPNLTIPSLTTSPSTPNTSTTVTNTTLTADAQEQAAKLLNNRIAILKKQIENIEKRIQATKDELNIVIPMDKKYWANRWEKEAAQDKKDLLSAANMIGINI